MIDLNALPLDVSKTTIEFRNYLKISWPYLDELMNNHDWDNDGVFIDDWLQCNWEFFVERELLGNDNFALTNFSVSHFAKRITNTNKNVTHTILADINNVELLYDFRTKVIIPSDKPKRLFSFRTYKDGGYGL